MGAVGGRGVGVGWGGGGGLQPCVLLVPTHGKRAARTKKMKKDEKSTSAMKQW